ncbi:carbamoyltransferase [Kitasatospora phosalacinea]|uniref:carbamoyltransferase family protein n=1 Tax=Kitasatospora phosalacinea TaxID=2065 RepID=UPI00364D67F0
MSGSGASAPAKAVLGLSALSHDPAACLFVDGRLVGAVEEERLNRQKRTLAFPHRAIDWLLERSGLDSLADVDVIAYYWDDRGQVPAMLQGSLASLAQDPVGMGRHVARRLSAAVSAPGLLRRELSAHCGDPAALPRIVHVPHHEAHLAAALHSSPPDCGAALVIDGRGECSATSLFDLGDRTGLLLEHYDFPHSLGVFYGAATQALGYTPISDEYKVMGLASYGSPSETWSRAVDGFLQVSADGRHRLDAALLRADNCTVGGGSWLNEAGRKRFAGDFWDPDGRPTQEARDFAHAVQRRLEEAVLGLVRRLVDRTGSRRISVVGGVAMNARAIGRIRESGLVDDVHVPLAPTDAGACIGAALRVLEAADGFTADRASLADPFLGPDYSDEEIERLLVQSRWPYTRIADPAAAAAHEIAHGRIIGWFDGRLEFGDRALGARSILGDPRDATTRERMNTLVKRRETYRPFAPSVLEEHAAEYFSLAVSRRMGEICEVRERMRSRIPAVVHVDGTARPQTVPSDFTLPSYRRLIECFLAETGVPMVVNTSFNVKDEPIVCSPDDALRCFAASGLERLFLGPFLVTKGTP